MPEIESIALSDEDMQQLEALRIELGLSTLDEVAEFLTKRALRRYTEKLPGRRSVALVVCNKEK